jgi:hypothetical protein
LAAGAGAPAWETLGQLHAAQDDHARASQCLLNALRLQHGEPVQPLEPATTTAAPAAVEQRDQHGLPHLGDDPA